jgi:hypothetical protein
MEIDHNLLSVFTSIFRGGPSNRQLGWNLPAQSPSLIGMKSHRPALAQGSTHLRYIQLPKEKGGSTHPQLGRGLGRRARFSPRVGVAWPRETEPLLCAALRHCTVCPQPQLGALEWTSPASRWCWPMAFEKMLWMTQKVRKKSHVNIEIVDCIWCKIN